VLSPFLVLSHYQEEHQDPICGHILSGNLTDDKFSITVKPLSIVSEGTAKNRHECWNMTVTGKHLMCHKHEKRKT
jgi:hypothetical protein